MARPTGSQYAVVGRRRCAPAARPRPCGRRLASTRKHDRVTSITRRAARSSRADVALADEHHVDVARVVQLVAAELPHADDDQPVGLRDADECDGGVEHVAGEGAHSRHGDRQGRPRRAGRVPPGAGTRAASNGPARPRRRHRRGGRESRSASTSTMPGSVPTRRPRLRLAATTATSAATRSRSARQARPDRRLGRNKAFDADRARPPAPPSARSPRRDRAEPPRQCGAARTMYDDGRRELGGR